jgi:hypothetical protein
METVKDKESILIGISGKARVGKDTAGTYLYNKIGAVYYNTYITAYANTLKQDLIEKFNLSYTQVYGDLKEIQDERYPKQTGGFWTPREMMQAYGQFMRSFDNDYWVKALFRNVVAGNVIITDLRQPNEVKAVLDRGGYHIRITRNNRPFINGEEHETETALDDNNLPTHYVIANNGSTDDLYKKLDYFVENVINIKETKKWQAKQ